MINNNEGLKEFIQMVRAIDMRTDELDGTVTNDFPGSIEELGELFGSEGRLIDMARRVESASDVQIVKLLNESSDEGPRSRYGHMALSATDWAVVAQYNSEHGGVALRYIEFKSSGFDISNLVQVNVGGGMFLWVMKGSDGEMLTEFVEV